MKQQQNIYIFNLSPRVSRLILPHTRSPVGKMVHLSTISSFAAVVALAAAAAVPLNHVLHEKRDDPSAFWQKRDRVARDALLPMRIGLKQGNLHTLYDKLMEV